jgi:hypothetical protein
MSRARAALHGAHRRDRDDLAQRVVVAVVAAAGTVVYIVFGGLVLVAIVAMLTWPRTGGTTKPGKTLFLAALAFFAAATWEVCGFGSTGRMLHPDQAARPLAHNILVTQSSKLMFEFLFAWSLLLASVLLSRRA